MSLLKPTPEMLRHLDLCAELAREYGAGYIDRIRLNDPLVSQYDKDRFNKSLKDSVEN